MKKRLLALITSVALVGTLLAGCGGDTGSGSTNTPAAGNTDPAASGSDWPTGSVSIVVPASAGGGTDLLARVLADKLTQAAMLACLLTRFPLMAVPLAIMVVKEIFMAITGLLVIRKTGSVFGADWHGKVTTWLLYAMMVLHLFWYNIPEGVSRLLIGICAAMLLLSFALYGIHHIRTLRGTQTEK